MDRKKRLSRDSCSHRWPADRELLSKRGVGTQRIVPGDQGLIAAVSRHVHTYIGQIENVLRLHADDPVHVDVHHVPPSPGKPFHAFVTSGMSERAMVPPEEAGACDYAELVILLPETWPVRHGALRKQENRWPLLLLSDLASYPHRRDAWLWEGHTVADAEPPPPLAEGVGFCCAALTRTTMLGKGFSHLQESPDRMIHFFTVELLYEAEMRFAHRYGTSALFERFRAAGVSSVIDIVRPNLCSDSDAVV